MKRMEDGRYVDFRWQEGVLIGTFLNKDRSITREIAKAGETERFKMQEGKESPLMIKAEKWVHFTAGALHYFANSKRKNGISAAAIIISDKRVAYYAGVFKRILPELSFKVEFFSDEDAALKWLKQFVTEIS